MSRFFRVLAHGLQHPFSSTVLADLLNKEAFKYYIDGLGPYEEFTWGYDGYSFEPDIDCGPAEVIHRNDELYEDDISITLIKWSYCKGYSYPKEYFCLVIDQKFEQKILREKYPREILKCLKFPSKSGERQDSNDIRTFSSQ